MLDQRLQKLLAHPTTPRLGGNVDRNFRHAAINTPGGD